LKFRTFSNVSECDIVCSSQHVISCVAAFWMQRNTTLSIHQSAISSSALNQVVFLFLDAMLHWEVQV